MLFFPITLSTTELSQRCRLPSLSFTNPSQSPNLFNSSRSVLIPHTTPEKRRRKRSWVGLDGLVCWTSGTRWCLRGRRGLRRRCRSTGGAWFAWRRFGLRGRRRAWTEQIYRQYWVAIKERESSSGRRRTSSRSSPLSSKFVTSARVSSRDHLGKEDLKSGKEVTPGQEFSSGVPSKLYHSQREFRGTEDR